MQSDDPLIGSLWRRKDSRCGGIFLVMGKNDVVMTDAWNQWYRVWYPSVGVTNWVDLAAFSHFYDKICEGPNDAK